MQSYNKTSVTRLINQGGWPVHPAWEGDGMSFLNRDEKGTGSNFIHSSSNKIMNINGLNGLKLQNFIVKTNQKKETTQIMNIELQIISLDLYTSLIQVKTFLCYRPDYTYLLLFMFYISLLFTKDLFRILYLTVLFDLK